MTDTTKKPETAKPAAKKPSDAERIDAIVAVLKANGLSLPKDLG